MQYPRHDTSPSQESSRNGRLPSPDHRSQSPAGNYEFPGPIDISAGNCFRSSRPDHLTARTSPLLLSAALGAVLMTQTAQASLLHGETLDAVANGVSWVAIVLVPIVGITVFWLVHILPEKIAHKKKHPQTRAIQCLCLLSLCFGGLLWPIAWLWAYTKPVLHKLAYGTDEDDSLDHHDTKTHVTNEVETLRARVAELEAKLNTNGGNI